MQYNARQFNAKQCNTMRNSEYRAVQCNAIIAPVEAICQLAKMKNAIQFVLYNLLQYNTIHYAKRSEAQFPAMRFSTKQDGAVEIFMYAIKVGTMMRSVLQFHPRRRQVFSDIQQAFTESVINTNNDVIMAKSWGPFHSRRPKAGLKWRSLCHFRLLSEQLQRLVSPFCPQVSFMRLCLSPLCACLPTPTVQVSGSIEISLSGRHINLVDKDAAVIADRMEISICDDFPLYYTPW